MEHTIVEFCVTIASDLSFIYQRNWLYNWLWRRKCAAESTILEILPCLKDIVDLWVHCITVAQQSLLVSEFGGCVAYFSPPSSFSITLNHSLTRNPFSQNSIPPFKSSFKPFLFKAGILQKRNANYARNYFCFTQSIDYHAFVIVMSQLSCMGFHQLLIMCVLFILMKNCYVGMWN